MDTKKLTEADVKETRIALAFFGGVALAVYESGVAVEFFRLVKGEGFYAELKRKIGDVSVDIITGTSAGGLNGAFLANALVNRGAMRKLLTLWREEGDIDKLLYSVWERNPQSLLDGDRFRKKVCEALMVKRTAPPHEAALQSTLDLFLTATNLDGDRVVIMTPDHEEISTRTHRQVFHFRFRKKKPTSEEKEINDFKTEEDVGLLAQAVGASASFPLAFAPVLVEKSGLGRRASHLEADAYHIDGGVLDNKPIDLCLQAIAKQSASKQIERLLFYIEPDPEQIDSRVCQIAARPYSAPEVVIQALVGLPGYQSITTALQDIERHNRTVEDLRRTLQYYETIAAKYHETPAGKLRSEKNQPTGTTRIRYVESEDGPTALFRAQEDGYLDLRLQREFPPEFFKLFMEVVAKAKDTVDTVAPKDEHATRWGRLLSFFTVDAVAPKDEYAAVKEKIYLVKIRILLALDLKYHRRLYRYLVQVVRQLYPEPLRGTGGGTGVDWDYIWETTARLNLLKNLLYEQDELIAQQERSQAEALGAELAEIRAQLRELLEKLGAAATSATGLLSNFEEKLKTTEFLYRRIEFLDRLRDTVFRRLENEYAELCKEWEQRKSELSKARPFKQRIDEGYWSLRDALESFYLRDMIVYPLMSGDELAAELQPIRFARISPADADKYIPGLSAKDKVAGENFVHFGGFLSEAWRGNDLTWGRLDAAEIIFRKLLPNHSQLGELIKEAHEEIISDMNSLGMGISTSAAALTQTERPKRENLIGKQDLSAIPADQKIKLSWRGAIIASKIVRQTVAQTESASLFRGPLYILDKVILLMTGIFVLFARVFVKLFRWRVLLWLILAAALIGLGVLLHLAWEHPLGELWGGFWQRLTGFFQPCLLTPCLASLKSLHNTTKAQIGHLN